MFRAVVHGGQVRRIEIKRRSSLLGVLSLSAMNAAKVVLSDYASMLGYLAKVRGVRCETWR